MKTKHILTAMVLPAMLAACTADEIVENNNVNLDGVAKLNPITFTIGENVDSRLLWDESGVGNWKWGAEGDQFSAFLVSAGNTDVLNKLLTNYVYSSEDGVNYTTTSVMTEGTYWFYAPGSQDKKDNDLISFKLPTAQGPEYYKSDDAQMFFTPLYRLAKDDAPENLDLELTSWYGRAVMPITNGTDEAFTINQIILELNDGDWIVEGTISTNKLAENGLAYAFVDGVKTPIRNLDNNADNNETLAELKARLQKADDIVSQGAKTSKTLVLDLGKGVKLASGASKTFTMLVPATAEDVTCDVKIITDKGLVEINAYETSNYTQEGVQFKHNGIMPMFGLKNANSTEFKNYKVEEDDLEDFGAKYYVTTYEYMMDLINTVNGDLTVYNIGDWAIDAKMAKAITNSDAHVTFTQPIEIADEDNKVELTKVEFAKVTVAEGTEVAFGKNTSAEDLNVEAGAKVTVNALGTDNTINAVANEGELVINDGAAVTYVETSGKLTIVKTGINATDVKITAGELNFTAAANTTATYKASDLEIARASKKNVTITIGANVTFNADVAVEADAKEESEVLYQTKIVNNGTISLSKDLTINGDLENNKTISTVNTKALHVYGTMTNALNASVTAPMGVHEGASVENNGIFAQVWNSGTITAGSQSVTTIKGVQDTGKVGVVDNSNKALVTLASNDVNTVKYVFSSACDSEDLMELDTKKYAINTLVFKGQVTLDEAWDSSKLPLYGVDVLEFATGSSLYVNLPTQTALPINITKIIISDNVSWYGFSGYANINLTSDNEATEIHVCKNKNLTKAESIVVNGTIKYTTETELGANDVEGKVNGAVVSSLDVTNP